MPLYVGDYLASTSHLTVTEHGCYLLLIMHYWTNGGLPNDERLLARIAKMTPEEWGASRPVIRPFFSDDWKHKRIDFELAETARLSAAGRTGGLASAARRLNGSSTIRQRSVNDPSTIRSNDSPTIHSHTHSQSLLSEEEDS